MTIENFDRWLLLGKGIQVTVRGLREQFTFIVTYMVIINSLCRGTTMMPI